MKHDYLENIIGEMNCDWLNESHSTPTEFPCPFQAVEHEFIPDASLFGFNDKGAAKELVSLLSEKGVNRVMVAYPTYNNDRHENKKSVLQTFKFVESFQEEGIDVAMTNINTVKKVNEVSSHNLSYLSCIQNIPMVEKYCREHDIPFLPVAGSEYNFKKRRQDGYRVVKAFHYKNNNLQDIVKPKYPNPLGSMLFTIGGGIKPVDLCEETHEPLRINAEYQDVIGMNLKDPSERRVVSVTSTQLKTFLKNPTIKDPLAKVERYLDILANN
jgi:hypothetical protein